jgi:hypothetical protein
MLELNDREIAQTIKIALLTTVSEVIAYKKSWSEEYSLKTLYNFPERIKQAEWFRFINPYNIPKEELFSLGFRLWSEEDKMLLIPLWIVQFLDRSIECVDINNNTDKLSNFIDDNDNRFGCLSYGILLK